MHKIIFMLCQQDCQVMMTEKTKLWLTNCWVCIPYSNNRNSSLKYDTRRLLKMAGPLSIFKTGSHMPAACLRLYHYASTCRRNTGKVELNSTVPAYRRCNCGTGGNRRTNIHIIYVLNYHRYRRRYVAGIYVNQALQSTELVQIMFSQYFDNIYNRGVVVPIVISLVGQTPPPLWLVVIIL